MPRPKKKGLDWYKKDIDYYEDFKIIDLLNEYGPLGNTIYDCILCMVYREGYYLEVTPERLAYGVIRVIGNKWVKNKNFVLQVIFYCAELGLFDKDLLEQGIITSAGIQRRYSDATSRNKVDKSKYWLLNDDGQPLESASFFKVSATETQVNVTETPVNAAESDTKNKSKRKNKRESRNNAPTISQIRDFVAAENLNVDPEIFFNYNQALGWKTSAGAPIEDWRPLCRNWSIRERSTNSQPAKTTYDVKELESLNVFNQWKGA